MFYELAVSTWGPEELAAIERNEQPVALLGQKANEFGLRGLYGCPHAREPFGV